MKFCWELITNTSKIWNRILNAKYNLDKFDLLREVPKKRGSCLWNSILKLLPKVQEGIGWTIGDGSKVLFWKDCWTTSNTPLLNYVTIPLTSLDLKLTTDKLTSIAGQWDWNKISNILPEQKIQEIIPILPPNPLAGTDKILWKWTYKGGFSTSSAYEAHNKDKWNPEDPIWKAIWAIKVQERV